MVPENYFRDHSYFSRKPNYGNLKSLIINKISPSGKTKFLFSRRSGLVFGFVLKIIE